MKSEEQKIIFLNSFLPRTGHNFASEVIRVFSDHKVLAHSRSETRLSSLLKWYYTIYDNRIYHKSDKEFFDQLFIDDLRKKILGNTDNKFVMLKDTSFLGADLLPRVFPDDVHIILLRDPKSVFLSLIKGMNLQKKTQKNALKKIGIKTGLYPYYYSKKISNQVIKELPDFSRHSVLRYEDLVRRERKTLLQLKETLSCLKTLDEINYEIDQIQVINSSFFKEVNATKIWDKKPRTSEFNPLERKGNSFLVRKAIELGSKKLRKKLNYI